MVWPEASVTISTNSHHKNAEIDITVCTHAQEELGGSTSEAEIEDMRVRGKAKKWNEDTAEHFNKELSKMQRLNPQVAEFSIQKNYLDLLLVRFHSHDLFDILIYS